MPSEPVTRRTYESPRRREHALETRRAVVGAARELFIERGYVTTTVGAIAARATVSPETVYATFKTKRAILAQLVDESIAGDDEPIPVLEREWVRQMREEDDVARRLRILARNGRLILERTAPIYDVLRGAAAGDPEIATLLEQINAQRFTGQQALLAILTTGERLREGVTPSAAADVLFAIGSPETYRQLVVDRGWSADRFERWYGQALALLLLPGVHEER